MPIAQARAEWLEQWTLVIFGAIVGAVGLLWLVFEEVRHRKTAGARRLEKLRSLLHDLVQALEAEDARAALGELRSCCPNRYAFEATRGEALARLLNPVYYSHGVDWAWQAGQLPAAEEEDPKIAELSARFGGLCSFGIIGPAGIEKGGCVVVSGLDGEGSALNGEMGVIRDYVEAETCYEVAFVFKDSATWTGNLPAWSLKQLGDKEVVQSVREHQLEALKSPAVQVELEKLRAECNSTSHLLYRTKALNDAVMAPIFQRHGVNEEWCAYVTDLLGAQASVINEVATEIDRLLSVVASPGQEEPAAPAEERQLQPAPGRRTERPQPSAGRSARQVWEVAGDVAGGLPVQRNEDWQAEEPVRLLAGALVEQLALDSGYLQYEKLTGGGPSRGWVSLTFEGKEALVRTEKRPPEVWIFCVGTRGDCQPFVALALGLCQADYYVRVFGPEDQEAMARTHGLPFIPVCPSVERKLCLVLEQRLKDRNFLDDLVFEELYHEKLLQELEAVRPEVLIYSALCEFVALSMERKFGIPAVRGGLHPEGLDSADADFSREEFVKHYRTIWEKYCRMEDSRFRLRYGVAAFSDMGFERYFKRRTSEGHLVGFLASIGDYIFPPPAVQQILQRHTYTGFWFLEPEGAEPGPGMEGWEDLERVQAFLAAGPAAYMGWGSCTSSRGPHHMVELAVGALKEANLRGIILAGWAKLSRDVLHEAVGHHDPRGLCEYAEANVLFVERVSHAWLFPRCVCHVHHGGVGTLAASWRSGRPVVVTPIWADQFSNAGMVKHLFGIAARPLDELTAPELGGHLKEASTSLFVSKMAGQVAEDVRRQAGVRTAVEFVNKLLREEIRLGKWHKRWASSGDGWPRNWGMARYV